MVDPLFSTRHPNPFTPITSGPIPETDKGYGRYEATAKALFEQFKFLYEGYGAHPTPESPTDFHLHSHLVEAKSLGATHLDGSEIRLTSGCADPFGETGHSHLQRFFVTGAAMTPYHHPDFMSGLHNTGYENFTGFRVPFYYFADPTHVLPYFCATDHNFYTEISNLSFTSDSRYDRTLPLPIYHLLHHDTFSERGLTDVGLEPCLRTFDIHTVPTDSPEIVAAIRTLNFSHRLLGAVILVQGAFTSLFGTSIRKDDMIRHLQSNWTLDTGRYARQIHPFHHHVLNYLLSASHMVAYMVTYCVYRDKYGDIAQDPAHSSVYVGHRQKSASFKGFLSEQASLLLRHWSTELSQTSSTDTIAISSLRSRISTTLYLLRLFGLGYRTSSVIGENHHYTEPANYSDCLVDSPYLDGISPLVRHCPNSPLWKLWFAYAGKFWLPPGENRQLFKGTGPSWKRLNDEPRAWLYHIGYQHSKRYWQLFYDAQASGWNLPSIHSRRKLNQIRSRLV